MSTTRAVIRLSANSKYLHLLSLAKRTGVRCFADYFYHKTGKTDQFSVNVAHIDTGQIFPTSTQAELKSSITPGQTYAIRKTVSRSSQLVSHINELKIWIYYQTV